MDRLIQFFRSRAPAPDDRLARLFVALALCAVVLMCMGFVLPYGAWWAPVLMLLLIYAAYRVLAAMMAPLPALLVGEGEVLHSDDPAWRDLAQRLNQLQTRARIAGQSRRALLTAIRRALRGPLSRARLHAELVEAGPSRDALLGELSQMRELISALVEAERLSAGRKALRRKPCDLGRLLMGFSRSGMQIVMDEDLPQLKLDAGRMQLLMRNLINNALWHNHKNRGEVRVQLRKEGEGLRLTVRDFGPGVPDAMLSHLGEPFFRIDRPESDLAPMVGGLGLGLHLCRLIAAAHGGQLVFRNREVGFEAQLTLS